MAEPTAAPGPRHPWVLMGLAAVGCWCRIQPRCAADEFWSPAGLEPEESSKSGSKKLDAMTLIKEGKLPALGRKPVVWGPCVP